MSDQELSESGAPIYRYENVKPKEFTHAIGDGESIEAISNHIEKNVGKISSVYHEIISDLVHIDVHWVAPTEERPFHTFVTSGMSDQPMNVPAGMEEAKYSELCILLPENWFPKGVNSESMEEAFKDEKIYWPIRWLKILCRFPHQYNTWLSYGHTIPNGESAAPFIDGTKQGCMILLPSLSLGNDFYELKISEEKIIHFYCLYPLYKEEMDLKLAKGADALLDKFEEFEVMDVIDLQRPNTCKKKGLFGSWTK